MQSEKDKIENEKGLQNSRVAAADELQKRLNHHSQNNRLGKDLNNADQGRNLRQQIENQEFNSYLIGALIILILIALSWVFFKFL